MKKKTVFMFIIFLVVCLAGWGIYLLWDKLSSTSFEKEISSLNVTIENVTKTGGTLRFKHPNPEVFKHYEVEDFCFISKKENDKSGEIIKAPKKGTPLTLDKDSSAICEKNWEKLYGSLEPGEYKIIVFVRDCKFFKGNDVRPFIIHFKVQ